MLKRENKNSIIKKSESIKLLRSKYYFIKIIIGIIMRLSEVTAYGDYIIKEIYLPSTQKIRLEKLFICAERKICVLHVNKGKVVVFASGTAVGLSRSVCDKIEVFKQQKTLLNKREIK